QGSELVFRNILKFVHEQHARRFRLLCCETDNFEQGRQVLLEVSVVGKSGFRVEIQTDFDVVVFDSQRLRETGERTETFLCGLLRAIKTAQLKKGQSQLRGKQSGQRSIFRRLDP